jgi:hypothetical protein
MIPDLIRYLAYHTDPKLDKICKWQLDGFRGMYIHFDGSHIFQILRSDSRLLSNYDNAVLTQWMCFSLCVSCLHGSRPVAHVGHRGCL